MLANKQTRPVGILFCFKPIITSLLNICHLAVNNTRTVVLRYLIYFNHLTWYFTSTYKFYEYWHGLCNLFSPQLALTTIHCTFYRQHCGDAFRNRLKQAESKVSKFFFKLSSTPGNFVDMLCNFFGNNREMVCYFLFPRLAFNLDIPQKLSIQVLTRLDLNQLPSSS